MKLSTIVWFIILDTSAIYKRKNKFLIFFFSIDISVWNQAEKYTFFFIILVCNGTTPNMTVVIC